MLDGEVLGEEIDVLLLLFQGLQLISDVTEQLDFVLDVDGRLLAQPSHVQVRSPFLIVHDLVLRLQCLAVLNESFGVSALDVLDELLRVNWLDQLGIRLLSLRLL